jgi:uncharacterized phage protein (TIGR01671 family)
MRNIKFRGKLAKSPEDWYYGSLARDIPNNFYYIIDELNGWVRDIIESTIGQCTGLHDKNGIEIYEGDIVQDHFYEKKAKIIYMEAAFYLDYTFDFIQYGTNHNRYQLISNYDTREALEVIGNIYDNPELIKEAKI